jgi:hypothetical protein
MHTLSTKKLKGRRIKVVKLGGGKLLLYMRCISFVMVRYMYAATAASVKGQLQGQLQGQF